MKEKQEKIKENITTFKKIWKNPKYNTLIKIGFYFTFIFVLSLIVRCCERPSTLSTPVEQEEKTSIEKMELMQNYEYTIEIQENQTTQTVKGIRYNETNDFEFSSQKYTIINHNIYQKINNEIVSQLFVFDINHLFPDNIKTYITEENLKNEIEYQNNETKKEYHILNFPLFSSSNPNKFIILTIYENDEYITKIEIDGTDILKDINPNLTNYNIIITYENINAIKNYKSS